MREERALPAVKHRPRHERPHILQELKEGGADAAVLQQHMGRLMPWAQACAMGTIGKRRDRRASAGKAFRGHI